MTRKIKIKTKERKQRIKKTFDLNWFNKLSPQLKQDILSVMLIISGFLILFSLFNLSGNFGNFLSIFIKKLIGNSIYILSLLLIFIGLIGILKIENILQKKIFIGLIASILSFSALFHSFIPLNDDIALNSGIEGKNGGYLGFLLTVLLRIGVGDNITFLIFLIILIFTLSLTLKSSIIKLVHFLSVIFLNKIPLISHYFQHNIKQSIKDSTVLPSINKNEKGKLQSIKKDNEIATKDIVIKTPDLEIKKKKISLNPFSEFKVKDQKIEGYKFPPLDLLEYSSQEYKIDEDKLKLKAHIIKDKLSKFGIDVEMNDVIVGPTVIRYTLKPSEDVKLSKILALEKDLALALEAQSIRIEAPIPGKSLVGIELPNENRISVRMRDLFESPEYQAIKSNLKLVIGRDVANKPFIGNLKDMPHLLVAGQTGSGKSVCINALIISLLYQNSPDDLRMLMIDPKQVELGIYNNIPHLLVPIISEVDNAIASLKWAVAEMEKRYKIMKEAKVRDIDEYNNMLTNKEDKMYKIVIIIDEMADLMMQAGKDAETLIVRLAQKARATGIHLILATQRPSVNVVTGLIKANMPTRIAFTTASIVDSKTVLDYGGAEKLLNKGDMLYKSSNMKDPIRIQGVFVSTEEVNRVVNRIKVESIPDDFNLIKTNEENKDNLLQESVLNTKNEIEQQITNFISSSNDDDETLAIEAIKIILKTKKASASYLQRTLRLGYSRAARIMDILTERGWLGQSNGAKPRDIIYSAIPEEIKKMAQDDVF